MEQSRVSRMGALAVSGDGEVTDVTLEALEAAARLSGYEDARGVAKAIIRGFSAGQTSQSPRELTALASLIMKHEPELIGENFEEQTEREFKELTEDAMCICGSAYKTSLLKYRQFVKKWSDVGL